MIPILFCICLTIYFNLLGNSEFLWVCFNEAFAAALLLPISKDFKKAYSLTTAEYMIKIIPISIVNKCELW